MSQPVLPLSTPNVQKSSAVYKNVKECVSTVMLCIVIVYILPGKFIL